LKISGKKKYICIDDEDEACLEKIVKDEETFYVLGEVTD